MKIGDPLDLTPLAGDPPARLGSAYYNTTTNKIRFSDGVNWFDVGTSTTAAYPAGQFRAYATTGAPTINGFNAWAKVTGLTNESWDDDNIWDAPNSRLVIPAGIVAGSRWAINAALLVSAVPAGYTYAGVFKNNLEVERIHHMKIAAAQDVLFKGFAVVPVVAADVIDVRLQWDGGSANLALNQGPPYDFVEGWRIK